MNVFKPSIFSVALLISLPDNVKLSPVFPLSSSTAVPSLNTRFCIFFVEDSIILSGISILYSVAPYDIVNDDVDVSTIGVYEITYTADDGCGNVANAVRTVNVVTGCALSLAISPPNGIIGDIVDIFAVGNIFNPIAVDNIVTFNGILTEVLFGTPTKLQVRIPEGASTGPVQVETQYTECGLANPVNFIVSFVDEEFLSGDILNSINSRRGSGQGNINSNAYGHSRYAIYNRDYAYSNFTEVVDENSMVQNVASIVLTKQGERIMNPEFGTKLESFVFNPIGDILGFEEQVLNEIKRAVGIYEPRVVIDTTQSIAKFSSDTNELQVLLSLIVPPGINREIGLTLSSVTRVDVL